MSEIVLQRLKCVMNQISSSPQKIFFVYGLFSLHTGETAFNKLKRYSIIELKKDVEENLSLKFPNLENMRKLWNEMNKIFTKCNFNIETDIWYNFQEEIYNHFQKEIDDFIIQRMDIYNSY